MSLDNVLPILTKGLTKTLARNTVLPIFFGSIKSKVANVRAYLLAEQNKEQKEIINDLRRRLALKDRIISIISHDARSPLHSLKSLLELLSEKEVTQEEFLELASNLNQQVGQLSFFLENLLKWIKNITTEIKPQFEQMPLQPLVDETIELFRLQAKRKHVNLLSQISSSTSIYADAEMVKLVLRNLINNAIKFCNPEDSVIIDAEEFLGEVSVSVEDNGQGIPQEQISKLFDVLHLSTVGTKDEIGTGFGLNLCKEFVEKMGGRISVTSVESEGSKFEFTIQSPSTPSYEFQQFIDRHE